MEIKPVYQWPGTPDPSLSKPTPCEQHRSDPGNRSFFRVENCTVRKHPSQKNVKR